MNLNNLNYQGLNIQNKTFTIVSCLQSEICYLIYYHWQKCSFSSAPKCLGRGDLDSKTGMTRMKEDLVSFRYWCDIFLITGNQHMPYRRSHASYDMRPHESVIIPFPRIFERCALAIKATAFGFQTTCPFTSRSKWTTASDLVRKSKSCPSRYQQRNRHSHGVMWMSILLSITQRTSSISLSSSFKASAIVVMGWYATMRPHCIKLVLRVGRLSAIDPAAGPGRLIEYVMQIEDSKF